MFSLEKIFAGFIDQLSQQHSHEVRLIDLHSRRIQRSLRLIDAAQGDCWTAPCSPVVPTFAEKASRQPGDLVTQDAYQARVHSWRNPLTIVSEVGDLLNTENQLTDRIVHPLKYYWRKYTGSHQHR